MEVAMTKQLTTLAIAALLGAPGLTRAEAVMPSDIFQASTMNTDSQKAAELESKETIKAEVVDVNGERLITETENGEQLVFFIEGFSEAFNVGDELELMLDHQTQTGVIMNVIPRQQESQI
jgi:hypothetical protein